MWPGRRLRPARHHGRPGARTGGIDPRHDHGRTERHEVADRPGRGRGPEPVGRTLRGRETIRKTLAARFKVIPDMRWDHKEYIYAGNRAISVWTVVGKGADGEALNYQGCDIYTFRGGKICAKDTYWKIVEYKDRL